VCCGLGKGLTSMEPLPHRRVGRPAGTSTGCACLPACLPMLIPGVYLSLLLLHPTILCCSKQHPLVEARLAEVAQRTAHTQGTVDALQGLLQDLEGNKVSGLPGLVWLGWHSCRLLGCSACFPSALRGS